MFWKLKSYLHTIYIPLLLSVTCLCGNEKTLSFDDAVARTLALSPRLKVADNEIEEKAGLRIQSSLLPNPVAAYSVENVYGNRNWHGWESAESRYEIGQLIELGGKRGYRYQAAKFEFYAAQAQYQAKQLSVLNRLLKLFTAVVAAQENLQLASSQVGIAEEVQKSVKTKVDAGKVSLIQFNKAEIALSTAQISLQRALAEFAKSKERLSVMWGDSCPDFENVCYPFYEVYEPIPFDVCLANVKDNPELLKSQMEYLAAHQNLHLEKARAVPDVTVLFGVKALRDTKNRGLILGASIPIPVFNRNQGNVHRARAEASKIQELNLALELALENKLYIAHTELLRAYQEAELIRSTVMKSAVQSFELAKEGYQEGKFEYLDMLDSQKTLFEVRERYIQALLDYHQSMADIEYLNTQVEDL